MRGFNGVTVAADGVSCSAGLDGGEAMSLTPLTPSQYGFPTAYRCASIVSPQYVAKMDPLTHTRMVGPQLFRGAFSCWRLDSSCGPDSRRGRPAGAEEGLVQEKRPAACPRRRRRNAAHQ